MGLIFYTLTHEYGFFSSQYEYNRHVLSTSIHMVNTSKVEDFVVLSRQLYIHKHVSTRTTINDPWDLELYK